MAYTGREESSGGQYSNYQRAEDILDRFDVNRVGDKESLINVAEAFEKEFGIPVPELLSKDGLWQSGKFPWQSPGYEGMLRVIGERDLATAETARLTKESAKADAISNLSPTNRARYDLAEEATQSLPMDQRGQISGGDKYLEDLQQQQAADRQGSGAAGQTPMLSHEEMLYQQALAQADGVAGGREDILNKLAGLNIGRGQGLDQRATEGVLQVEPDFRKRMSEIDKSPEALRKAAAETKLATLLKEGERIKKYDDATGREISMSADSWVKYETNKEFDIARTAAVENFNADLSGGIKGSDLVYAQLAIVLGSIGTGLAGGKNPALEAFNRLVDRDVNRQYKEQEERLKNMDLTNEQTQTMLSLAVTDRQNEIAGQLSVIAQSTTDIKRKTQIEELSAQLKQNAWLGTRRSWDTTHKLKQIELQGTLEGFLNQPKAQKTRADVEKQQVENNKMKYAVEELKKSFTIMAKKSSFGQRLMGYFGKETGFIRDVIRATHLMPTQVATYLNKRTNTLAQVVKALQGSRPSDFDWRKLEVLFPGVLDSEELAMADFEAVEAMVAANARAQMGDPKAQAEVDALAAALGEVYGAEFAKFTVDDQGRVTENKVMSPDERAAFYSAVEARGAGGKDFAALVKDNITSVSPQPAVNQEELLLGWGGKKKE